MCFIESKKKEWCASQLNFDPTNYLWTRHTVTYRDHVLGSAVARTFRINYLFNMKLCLIAAHSLKKLMLQINKPSSATKRGFKRLVERERERERESSIKGNGSNKKRWYWIVQNYASAKKICRIYSHLSKTNPALANGYLLYFFVVVYGKVKRYTWCAYLFILSIYSQLVAICSIWF